MGERLSREEVSHSFVAHIQWGKRAASGISKLPFLPIIDIITAKEFSRLGA